MFVKYEAVSDCLEASGKNLLPSSAGLWRPKVKGIYIVACQVILFFGQSPPTSVCQIVAG